MDKDKRQHQKEMGNTSTINPPVFWDSAVIIAALVIFAGLFPKRAEQWFSGLQEAIFTNASWFYVLAVALILITVAFLGGSRYGNIKLGPDHAIPDFSYFS